MCLLSKSQFWSNATKNVKNQLPIGFGPGDFSRNKRFEHFFFFLPCAFFFPKSRYGKKRLRRGMEKCLRSAQNEISVQKCYRHNSKRASNFAFKMFLISRIEKNLAPKFGCFRRNFGHFRTSIFGSDDQNFVPCMPKNLARNFLHFKLKV